MRKTLLQTYKTLKESGTTSDFPNILGNLMYRSLIDWAQDVPDVWRTYAMLGDLTDFRPATRDIGYEAEDLLPVSESGAYVDSALGDAAYQLRLATYGRGFSITRKVIINDDLGYIKKQPQRWGRSAARSIARFVSQTLLEGNGNTFDGNALFSVAHSNLSTGGGSVISSANIQTGYAAMEDQTVLGVEHQVTPSFLLVPPAIQFTARQILNSAIIVLAGTAGTVTERGNINVLSGLLGLAIDPFLTSATAYYLFTDPSDVTVLDVAFLNGKQTPDLLIERPTYMNLAGGDDPYEYEYDVLRYKVRYDYGGAVGLWWGAYKFAGA